MNFRFSTFFHKFLGFILFFYNFVLIYQNKNRRKKLTKMAEKNISCMSTFEMIDLVNFLFAFYPILQPTRSIINDFPIFIFIFWQEVSVKNTMFLWLYNEFFFVEILLYILIIVTPSYIPLVFN